MPREIEDYRQEELVILFTDAHAFTRVMLELGEGRVLVFLDELYDRLGAEVVGRGGDIVKYIGDGFLAVFPAGESQTDACRRAVEAGFAMRRSYHAIVDDRRITTETEMEIGLSLGRCERGVVGHRSFRSEDVFGDAVNIAAVIGHHRGIAVTATVHDALAGVYPTTRLPDRSPKWSAGPLAIWQVEEA